MVTLTNSNFQIEICSMVTLWQKFQIGQCKFWLNLGDTDKLTVEHTVYIDSRAGTLLPSSSTRRASIKSSGLGGCALGFKSGVALLVSILRCSAVIFVLWVRVRYGHKAFFVLRAFIDPSVTGWICVVFACSQSVHFVLLNPDFFFSHDLLELAAKIGHTTRAWVPSWGLFLAASFLYISNNRFCSHIDIQSSERRWETLSNRKRLA